MSGECSDSAVVSQSVQVMTMNKTLIAQFVVLCLAIGTLGGIVTFAVEYHSQGQVTTQEVL